MRSFKQKTLAQTAPAETEHDDSEKPRLTVDERVAHLTHVHNNQTEQIFAVMYTTIHKAAFDGSVPAVLHFLKLTGHRKVNVNSFDKNGHAPIHIACDCGHNNLVRFLIERGADVNLKAANDAATPLMAACKEGNTETVQVLLSHGAWIFDRNRAGNSAIQYAAQGDHVDCVRAIHGRFMSRKKELMDAAATAGNLSASSPLLKGNEQEDSSSEGKNEKEGDSSSMSRGGGRIELTEKEKEEAADYLKHESEFIDQRCNSEMTPLHLACHFNAFRIATFLVERKADVNALDTLAETPLHKAARGGHRTIYRMLVTAGADESIKSRMRDTPRNLLYDDAGL